VPALGTLLYRLQPLPDERWHALRSGLAAQGIAQKTPNSASKSVKDEAQRE